METLRGELEFQRRVQPAVLQVGLADETSMWILLVAPVLRSPILQSRRICPKRKTTIPYVKLLNLSISPNEQGACASRSYNSQSSVPMPSHASRYDDVEAEGSDSLLAVRTSVREEDIGGVCGSRLTRVVRARCCHVAGRSSVKALCTST